MLRLGGRMMVPKFRGWDRKNHVMYDFMMMCFNVNLKNVLYRNKLTDFDVDMCTGLKDESDVDIYEGDIVCVSDVYGDVSYVDAVIWGGKDGYPAFDFKNHTMEYDSNALSSIVNGGFEIIEVIGNIHENPELLKAKHD